MNTFNRIVKDLRALCQQVEQLQKLNDAPALQVDLAEAAGRLRLTLPPETYFSISVNVGFLENKAPDVEWTVYDQSKTNDRLFFKGTTLADAVAACIANHTPPVEPTLADVEETLAPMPF